ncbi:MAG: IS91 family transposase [Lachnospiraceae bacterium]|nr:IS91 family transposase [Lachnospiraceae bacterium]
MSVGCTIQDVFHRFYSDYEMKHALSASQRKAAYHIMNCKTGAFGINISVCEDCGCISVHYNSCRDRCCPMCQEFPKEKWVDARREDVLDAPYFHVVFTVPEELYPVIYSNQKLLYDALYHAASGTLQEPASDSRYLGADIGYICILHTWGSEMNFHPHIHAIVLGGGLDPGNHWKDNGEDFFLPVRVISRLFRGKYLAELKQLWKDGRLEFHGSAELYRNYYAFKELLDCCYSKEWISYCKKPFDGAGSVIRYLGKYTHRIAISNYRIKSMTDSTVTFTAKDYKNQGQWKEVTISGEEFIRRFLMHVPPKRFVRIRHYGLLSSRNKSRKISLCRNLLGCKKYLSRLKDLDAPAIIRILYNKDVCKCASCGGRIMRLHTARSFIQPVPHLLC